MKRYFLILIIVYFVIFHPLFSQETTLETTVGTGVVTLVTTPAGARIRFNREELSPGATGPGKVAAGTYRIELASPGYEDLTYDLTVREDIDYKLSFQLLSLPARVNLSNLPVDSRIFLNKTEIDLSSVLEKGNGELQLMPGFYTMEIERFGYEPVKLEMKLTPDRVHNLFPEFIPLTFRIEKIKFRRAVLTPSLTDGPGRIEGSFRVSAPGSGLIEITDDKGAIVKEIHLGPFTRNLQSFTWNGMDSRGEGLPDGEYNFKFKFYTEKENFAITGPLAKTGETEAEYRIEIDSHVNDYASPSAIGSGGSLLAPSASVAAVETFQAGSLLMLSASDDSETVTVAGGFRYTPLKSLEASLHGAYSQSSEGDSEVFSAGSSVKCKFPAPYTTFQWAGLLSLQWQISGDSAFGGGTSETEISTGIPLELSFGVSHSGPGKVRMFLTPLLNFIIREDDNFISGGLKAGVLWQYRYFITGLSVSVRTQSFSERLALESSPSSSLELGLRIPRTGVFIAGLGRLDFNKDNPPLVSAGLGITLLN
ncbi:MAG: PEGA domain-containing protein [Spirochaetales bacterium]|nr:PEGA domain-containing protein [Spirochaetales bacterium]